MKPTVGLKVIGKFGEGIITKIITASTGYCEVTYNSGKVKNEMPINLNDENGDTLKKKPVKKVKKEGGMSFEGIMNQIKFYVSEGKSFDLLEKLDNVTPVVKDILTKGQRGFDLSEKQICVVAYFIKNNGIIL